MSSFDSNLQAAMRNIAATRKTSFPWIRDAPHSQPYFSYSIPDDVWASSNSVPAHASPEPTALEQITLLTWNIDFMLPLTHERMAAALSYLQYLVETSIAPSSPTIIFLQEMLVSDLHLIQSTSWVRERFHLTDLDSTFWESGYYGTCTLIDKRLLIKEVFRVHYEATRFERDGLFVDIQVGNKGRGESKTLRFCNTHLESLVSNPPLRPTQLAVAAKFLHEPQVEASVLAGDLNAIQPFDKNLHSENNLRDVYLELGGQEDSEQGYTWGQQAQTKLRQHFGCSRMDKVFFTGQLKAVAMMRIGVDIEVEKEEDKERLRREDLEKGWVTDHLGLRADFTLADGDI